MGVRDNRDPSMPTQRNLYCHVCGARWSISRGRRDPELCAICHSRKWNTPVPVRDIHLSSLTREQMEAFGELIGVDPTSDHWPWTGLIVAEGPVFDSNGSRMSAQLISYELFHATEVAPEALIHCDEVTCVNPDHLQVTDKEKITSVSMPQEESLTPVVTCLRGHDQAIYGVITARGWRRCLACQRLGARIRKYRNTGKPIPPELLALWGTVEPILITPTPKYVVCIRGHDLAKNRFIDHAGSSRCRACLQLLSRISYRRQAGLEVPIELQEEYDFRVTDRTVSVSEIRCRNGHLRSIYGHRDGTTNAWRCRKCNQAHMRKYLQRKAGVQDSPASPGPKIPWDQRAAEYLGGL